ncbi:hypothetical protein [Actinomycetospora sp. CA-053990]|uniref:phage terminase small subunit n=1 Tax=Actinomycetospora sp. CA-053990 TaxID=3239891 RepID=UPI003D8D92D3
MTTLVDDGELHGPELPMGVLPNGGDWHPQTRDLWDALRRNPLLAGEPDLGWQFLIDTMLMHHTMWTKDKWEFAAEVRLRVAKFGATPEDRMRLKMKVEKPDTDKQTGPATVTDATAHRRNLRIAE